MAKEKKILKPEMTEVETGLHKKELKKFVRGIKSLDMKDENSTFFKEIAKEMMSPKNIELKTEYLNIKENFASCKLEFLAVYADMPYLSSFVNILERKRVSLKRKSRKEMVMMLQEKMSEEREVNQKNVAGAMGVT